MKLKRFGSRLLRRQSVNRLSFLLMWLIGALVLYYVAVLDRNAFNVRCASFVTPALYALWHGRLPWPIYGSPCHGLFMALIVAGARPAG